MLYNHMLPYFDIFCPNLDGFFCFFVCYEASALGRSIIQYLLKLHKFDFGKYRLL